MQAVNFASLGANMEPEWEACWARCAVFLSGHIPKQHGVSTRPRQDRTGAEKL